MASSRRPRETTQLASTRRSPAPAPSLACEPSVWFRARTPRKCPANPVSMRLPLRRASSAAVRPPCTAGRSRAGAAPARKPASMRCSAAQGVAAHLGHEVIATDATPGLQAEPRRQAPHRQLAVARARLDGWRSGAARGSRQRLHAGRKQGGVCPGACALRDSGCRGRAALAAVWLLNGGSGKGAGTPRLPKAAAPPPLAASSPPSHLRCAGSRPLKGPAR